MEIASKYNSVCHTCGGFGRDGGCPRCGLTLRKRAQMQVVNLDVPVDIIPLTYQGKLWECPESDGNVSKTDFDSKLERVLKEFLEGRLPKFSMYIGAPAKYGKHMFAYSCMQTAMTQHYSVAPLFSTGDWRRLYRVSQVNPMYSLYRQYYWDDLISRDVVFLSVDHSEDRYDVISLLQDILDTRAGFGYPTFIISDYRLEELSTRWNDNAYKVLYNPDPNRDLNRYPVIIQRFN